jgi:hypothetical protein
MLAFPIQLLDAQRRSAHSVPSAAQNLRDWWGVCHPSSWGQGFGSQVAPCNEGKRCLQESDNRREYRPRASRTPSRQHGSHAKNPAHLVLH